MTAAMPQICERLEAELDRRQVDAPKQVTRTGDRADRAQAEQATRINGALSAAAINKRMTVRRAIRRIDAGEYGRCLGCEAEIAPARLEAIPWAALCVDCQQEWEALLASEEVCA